MDAERTLAEFKVMDGLARQVADRRGRWPSLSLPVASICAATSSYLLLLAFVVLSGINPERVWWQLLALPAAVAAIAALITRHLQETWFSRYHKAFEALEFDRVRGRRFAA